MGSPSLANLQSVLDEISVLMTAAENAILKVEKEEGVAIDEEAHLLDQLRDLKQRVSVIDSILLNDLAKRTPFEERLISLPQGGTVEVRKSKPRKTWDHARLKSIVAEKIIEQAVDKETGSIDVPTTVLIQQAFDYVSFSTWKVTSLKAIDLDPDDYCEVGDAKPSAQIRH